MSSVLSVRIPAELKNEISNLLEGTNTTLNDFALLAIRNEVQRRNSQRILIVEDDFATQRTLFEHLENNSFHVVGIAPNGKEAIKLYKGLKPNVVLLDIMMPEVNGIEALQKIKAMDDKANVIIVSGLEDVECIIECIKGGARDYIVKPFSEEQLMNSLRTVLYTQDQDIKLHYNKAIYERLEKVMVEEGRHEAKKKKSDQ